MEFPSVANFVIMFFVIKMNFGIFWMVTIGFYNLLDAVDSVIIIYGHRVHTLTETSNSILLNTKKTKTGLLNENIGIY